MQNRTFIIVSIAALLSVSCGADRKVSDDSYFQLRGICMEWEDVTSDPEIIDWLGLMKETGMNTISVSSRDCLSGEYAELKQKCIDLGFDFEYEMHGMTRLLPRELFAEHPEYFRMDGNGERVPDYNCCPSNPEALAVIRSNVKGLADMFAPTNHRYYFWLHDGGDKCHCPECEKYNLSDQGLLIENTIIGALREFDPEAMLAHLAYDKTTPAPSCVKPAEGIFLEYAPIDRCHERPLSDSLACWSERTHWCNGDYCQMLRDNLDVFGSENAQVLEYWLDASLFSLWKKPQKPVHWDKEVFDADLRMYADLGIRNIICYGAWIDEDYVKSFGDISFIRYYGEALRDYRSGNE